MKTGKKKIKNNDRLVHPNNSRCLRNETKKIGNIFAQKTVAHSN